jgi:hypothetical protein
LLAKARFSLVQPTDCGETPEHSIIRFCSARVHWPTLDNKLQAAGFMAKSAEPAAGFTAERKHPRRRPGPKSADDTAAVQPLVWAIARQILEDDDQRPPPGYGRLMQLAHLVNAEIAKQGYQYQDEATPEELAATAGAVIRASMAESAGSRPKRRVTRRAEMTIAISIIADSQTEARPTPDRPQDPSQSKKDEEIDHSCPQYSDSEPLVSLAGSRFINP